MVSIVGVLYYRGNSLKPIKVVVTPIPFPKDDMHIPIIIATRLVVAPPEERKIIKQPVVRDVYAAMVIQ